MNRPKLIQLIHVAKTKLRQSDDVYQAVLVGVTGKASCGDMNVLELGRVLDRMKALGFTQTHSRTRGKRNPVRPSEATGQPDRLTDRQLYYIKGLFDLACRVTNEQALRALLRRQTGVELLEWVPRAKAPAVILMLKDITLKAGFDPDQAPGRKVET
jgi:hypothetical protein